MYLVVAFDDSIHVRHIRNSSRLVILPAPGLKPSAIAFTPSTSAWFSTSSEDGCVYLWYIPTWPEDQNTLIGSPPPKHDGKVNELTISPDGKMIAEGRSNGSVFVWDFESNRSEPRRMDSAHKRGVRSLAFSPINAEKLLSASDDRAVQVCDVATGKRLHFFKGHRSSVSSTAWSVNGDYVVSTSFDASVRVWKVGGKESGPAIILEGPHSNLSTRTAVFSPDRKFLVSGGDDTRVVVWKQAKPEAWERKHTLFGHSCPVCGLLVTPDSKYVISSSSDQTLRVWDLETGKEVQKPTKMDWNAYKMWWHPNTYLSNQNNPNYVISPQGIQLLGDAALSLPHSRDLGLWRLRFDREGENWWISSRDKDVIFLPKAYSPCSSLMLEDKILIGTASGHVYVIHLPKDQSRRTEYEII